MQLRYLLVLLGIVGCATGAPGSPDAPPGTHPDAVPGAPDAEPGAPDARPRPDAMPVAPDAMPGAPDAMPTSGIAPLLLTEVELQPSGAEFMEIGNPTASPVDLSHYYLSDAGSYYALPAHASNVGPSDFVAHFPSGATIAAHGLKVIAIDTAANFHTATGATADYSVADGTMIVVDGSAATLTNAGECAVLFYWDGQTDLVTDVDLMIVGIPSAGNSLLNKSGASFDGPDAGSTKTAYGTDAFTMQPQTSAPGSAKSTKRILLPAGHESSGVNGVGNTDQTSEDTRTTWDSTFTAPTPGTTTLAL